MAIDVLTKLMKLVRRLYPTGRAFKIPVGSIREKLHRAINITYNQTWLDIVGIRDTLFPDNDNFTDEDATQWERRLGLSTNTATSLEDRKAAIWRKMAHPNDKFERAHYLFIQYQLQLAGFKVWVYENRIDDGSGGYAAIFLNQFLKFHYDALYTGQFQHGDEQHGNWNIYEKVVNHLSNEEDALVNVVNGRQTFFIGGDERGKYANVKADREKEFRQLILRLKPVESAALLAIKYGDGEFDDLSTISVPTSYTSGGKIRLLENRLYYVSNPRVRVWDIDTDSEITSLIVGSANGNVNGFAWDRENNKIYLCDDSGTEQVRVYNMATQAAIPAEDFGAGTMDSPNAIHIYKGEAFVTDANNDAVYVYNLSTQALDRTIGTGWDGLRDIAVFEDRVFIVNYGSDSAKRGLHVYQVDGTELPDQFVALPTESPFSLAIENGYLYLPLYLGNVLRTYDIMSGKIENIDADISAASINHVTVSNDNMIWGSGSSPTNVRTRNT